MQGGNLNYLYEIDAEKRNNKYFMEPLLYAVKHNSGLSSYEVYKYYGEELQKSDLEIATEIVINEPDVFKDTAIADDPQLVLYLAQINPKVVLYMSEDLKKNGHFIAELCETGNREAIAYAAKECDISAVLKDNPELANNPEFIKEACKADDKVIDYVAKHTYEFGTEALAATQEVLRENFNIKVTEECREESIRLHEQIEQQKEEGKEPDYKLIAKATRIEGRPEMLDTRLEGLRRGDPKAIRYAERMLKYCKGMNEKDRQMLEQSLEIGIAIAGRQKEETKEEQDKKISPQEIERLAENSKLSEIQAEPAAIREQITLEREQTKENQEIGEM